MSLTNPEPSVLGGDMDWYKPALRSAKFYSNSFTLTATAAGGRMTLEKAHEKKAGQAEFIMLKEGRIHFEGDASDLREAAKRDEYIRAFLS